MKDRIHQSDVLQEAKAQRWRAIVRFGPERKEGLLVLGANISQVRETYAESFLDPELFEDHVRETATMILIEKWCGTADRGRWIAQHSLPIPHFAKKKPA